MAKKSYAVLGMGRFGRGVALALAQNGEEVMIVDKSGEYIEPYASAVTYAIVADLSDEEAVQDLGLGNMDAVIVAMGMDLEASILSVMIAKESGAKEVIAKAKSKRMGDILLRVGADRDQTHTGDHRHEKDNDNESERYHFLLRGHAGRFRRCRRNYERGRRSRFGRRSRTDGCRHRHPRLRQLQGEPDGSDDARSPSARRVRGCRPGSSRPRDGGVP